MMQRMVWALVSMMIMVDTASATHAHRFRVLAFYSTDVERDHVDFANDALKFYKTAAEKDGFEFESTTDWNELNATRLKNVQVVVWLNDFAKTEEQRHAFEQYMEGGGGWLGFHVSAYNDTDTHWPWFLQFLGGGVFYGNNWPPLPAKLNVDDKTSPITKSLPGQFTSPSNEWYLWKPSPRANKNVKVLLTLDPQNYPLGLKDTIVGGDLPVVWTNTKYRMLYMNMGHGDKIFDDPKENSLFENGLIWVGTPAANQPIVP